MSSATRRTSTGLWARANPHPVPSTATGQPSLVTLDACDAMRLPVVHDDVADLDLICVDRHVPSLTDLPVLVTVPHVL